MTKILLLSSLCISIYALQIPDSVYKKAKVTPESSYEVFKIMNEAKILSSKGKNKDASELFIKAITKATRSRAGKNIDQYDYLFANYGILKMLEFDKKDEDEYKKLAKRVLSHLDKTTKNGKNIWEDGDLGKFQLKMYQTISNHYAKLLYKESKRKDKKLLKQAFHYIEKAEGFIRSPEDFYIKDTKAWIENAIEGNPPLKDEKKTMEIIKVIKTKKDDNSTKKAL